MTPVLRETEDVVRSGNRLLCQGTCASVLFIMSNSLVVLPTPSNLIWFMARIVTGLFVVEVLCKNTGGGFTGLNNGDPPQRVCAIQDK